MPAGVVGLQVGGREGDRDAGGPACVGLRRYGGRLQEGGGGVAGCPTCDVLGRCVDRERERGLHLWPNLCRSEAVRGRAGGAARDSQADQLVSV